MTWRFFRPPADGLVNKNETRAVAKVAACVAQEARSVSTHIQLHAERNHLAARMAAAFEGNRPSGH